MKLTIKTNMNEQDLIEGCLNMKYSGVEFLMPLFFYALVKTWNIDKLTYYLNLLEVKNGS